MLETTCYCTSVRRTARAVTKVYDEVLAPAGLATPQFALLQTILRFDEEPSLSALADATGLDRSTLGRNLRVLQKSGHVRLGSGEDERTRVVSLTRSGRSTVEATLPLWEAAQKRVQDALTAAEHRLLLQLLTKLEAV